MSDAHSHEHHDHRPLYIKIFWALTALTALEVGIVFVPMGTGLMIAVLCGLAVFKAALVAIHYMHLGAEGKWLRYTVYGVGLIPVLYAFVLIAEGAWRLLRNVGVA
jgi:caa(3)-type oxidase subunit IV